MRLTKFIIQSVEFRQVLSVGSGNSRNVTIYRSTGICGVPSGVHVPKGNAVKIIEAGTTFFDIVSASCNSLRLRPAAIARRVLLPAAAPGSALQDLGFCFSRIRAVVEHQHHRSTSAAFQRDLVLAAPSRRKGWGKWRQRCIL